MDKKLEPNKANRKKFDIDLQYGKVREGQVADMLQNSKIEVKSERGMWMKTGNIAIEYESWSKPSGIRATESDYWFHNLCIGEDTFATLVFDTKSLKRIIDKLDHKKTVSGGDKYFEYDYAKLIIHYTVGSALDIRKISGGKFNLTSGRFRIK